MKLSSLRVLNLAKESSALSGNPLLGAFLLDSCQRKLWVYDAATLSPDQGAGQLYAGEEAYEFLLRVACGLESQVLGETDIFGQLKQAWKESAMSAELRAELQPWFQRLFEDTKEIRSQHIQNLGGASYGSLVRKLIRSQKGPVFLLGAGQIAQSVAPYLSDFGLWGWNRTEAKVFEMANSLSKQSILLENLSQESRGWLDSEHVVVCIPVGAAEDAERIELWKRSYRPGRTLIHLGARRSDAGAWAELPGFFSLDDLFALQKSQESLRSIQAGRALRACSERAKLRGLGSSLAIAHGWEDLAVFG